ncbi:MAG: DUF3179 domain-containing protein [Bacteroidales bacterium]|nr:DUF3179 domain-containing protein [Bacteroidales bacterium]
MMNKYILALVVILSFIGLPMKSQNNPYNLELRWRTDTSIHSVPLNEFTVLLKPDEIPPIDSPKFLERTKAVKFYFEHEPVIAIEKNGSAKAYPLSVLMYHEIVNDNLGELPILVTYCPLCNAGIVFDRRLTFEGKTYLLDFGVSGMLRKSDLVMWDRQTESWWQQLMGEALVGKLAGAELSFINSQIISVSEFFEAWPEGLMLSTETGHTREYGTNPYTGYDDKGISQPRLFEGKVDTRLPAMERVIDININGKYKIYPLSIVSDKQVINDSFQGEPIVIFYTEKTVSVLDENNIASSKNVGSSTAFDPRVDNKTLIFRKVNNEFKDTDTESTWTITGKCTEGYFKDRKLRTLRHGNHFAFAWFAFYPDSEIYED